MEEQQTQPILENLWWVIPGKIAGVRKPTSEEIAELKAVEVGAIVSVFHDDSNLNLYQQAGIPYLWLPIAIDSVPSQEQLQEFREFIERQNSLNHGVAVHCSTGRHRTGTMIAAYLIESGQTYQGAMEIILKANPSIELPETQLLFLQDLAQNQLSASSSEH